MTKYLPGRDLDELDYRKLEGSWIPRELARQAKLRRVDSREGASIVGRNGAGNYAGIVFPYFWPGEEKPREYILRLDRPELEARPDGTFTEKLKYIAPLGRTN